MKSAYKSYTFTDGISRIDEILDTSDNAYEEVNQIPSEDRLTYSNGFYVNCSALFVDIRGSSNLPHKYRRPTLAKIYRVYISEIIATMSGNSTCKEIRIVGDSVSGVFDTQTRDSIDSLFSTAATISSLVDIMNFKFEKRNIEPIVVGIGMDYGRALMIKAGYKGSGINDTVWMGDVLNTAAHLCNHGCQTAFDNRIMASSIFYENLNDDNKKLLTWNGNRQCYHGSIANSIMQDWLEAQKPPRNSFPSPYRW